MSVHWWIYSVKAVRNDEIFREIWPPKNLCLIIPKKYS